MNEGKRVPEKQQGEDLFMVLIHLYQEIRMMKRMQANLSHLQ
jgi:hypothetical protein